MLTHDFKPQDRVRIKLRSPRWNEQIQGELGTILSLTGGWHTSPLTADFRIPHVKVSLDNESILGSLNGLPRCVIIGVDEIEKVYNAAPKPEGESIIGID